MLRHHLVQAYSVFIVHVGFEWRQMVSVTLPAAIASHVEVVCDDFNVSQLQVRRQAGVERSGECRWMHGRSVHLDEGAVIGWMHIKG